MARRFIMFFLVMVVTMATAYSAYAIDPGNKRKGKYTYRKVYKACMSRGEVQVAKPPINPSDKTQAEWTQLFESGDFSAFGCGTEWATLSAEALADIYAYMHGHASDSPTPLKCK